MRAIPPLSEESGRKSGSFCLLLASREGRGGVHTVIYVGMRVLSNMWIMCTCKRTFSFRSGGEPWDATSALLSAVFDFFRWEAGEFNPTFLFIP